MQHSIHFWRVTSETALSAVREFFRPLIRVVQFARDLAAASRQLLGWPSQQDEHNRLLRELCLKSDGTTQELQSLRRDFEEQRTALPTLLRDVEARIASLTRRQADREARRLILYASDLHVGGDRETAFEILKSLRHIVERRVLNAGPYVHFNVGELLLEYADFGAAEIEYRKAFESRTTRLLQGAACSRLGYLHLLQTDWYSAIDMSEQALRILTDVGTHDLAAQTYVQLATALASRGDVDRAKEALKKALSLQTPRQRLFVPETE